MSDFFSSMLTGPQWLLMTLIPPAIVALYFLKLRRQPLEVPSTFLWRRTIEDMHVNSLWQRLRQNLLLFLQLLLIALLMLACLRPNWHGKTKLQGRLIFLVDTSASMTATDVRPSRLDQAREKVSDLIEQMDPGDVAMIVSFSDRAKVEQPFTTNKALLNARLKAIQPTQRTSDIDEALRVAAGLANPGRSGDTNAGDVAVAEAMPADVFVLSDGGFRTVPEFSWGNLNPLYLPIGSASASNLAVSAFSAQVNPARPDRMEAFVEVHNYSESDVSVELTLSLDESMLDAVQLSIAAGETSGTSFSFDRIEKGILKVALDAEDDLAADNAAYAAINQGRRARVMMVTASNDAMEMALGTDSASRLADVSLMAPSGLESKEWDTASEEGKYDLVIFDRCQPKRMPRSNTFFIGAIPPDGSWTATDMEKDKSPQILDIEVTHPLMRYLSFGDVRVARAQAVDGPAGAQVLIDSDGGALCAIAPREGFEDLVLGFALLTADKDGKNVRPNTDWPIRPSFPLFCKNVLEYLAGAGTSNEQISAVPGSAIPIRVDGGGATIDVVTPGGGKTAVVRDRNNAYVFSDTDQVGVYGVIPDGDDVTQRFSVNLFDEVESQIVPKRMFETAWNQVQAKESFETTRRDAWRWILLLAVIVLVVEWYIYNRRVYL